MIYISLKKNKLSIVSKDGSNFEFSNVNSWLRNKGFFWDKSDKSWTGNWFMLDEFKNEFEDKYTIQDNVDYRIYNKLSEGEPEQEKIKVRRSFDQSLLAYPPMLGNPPHERFQIEGIIKGITRSRYYYGWGMGSGKSYVASAIIAHRFKYNDCSKVLLLTTSIGVRNLYHELLKFIVGLKEEEIQICDKNFRNPFDSDCKAKIIVSSYGTFRLICNYYKDKMKIKASKPKNPFLPLKEWSEGNELMLILDEAHCAANPDSQQGYLIRLHSELFKYRYLFSGTPADKPEKLYNQYRILDPWLVYNLSFGQWKEKMADIGTYFSKYAIGEWKKDELKKQNDRFIKSHGERYTTTELIELPNYNEKKIYLELSKKHRTIYQMVASNSLNSEGFVNEFINKFPYVQIALDNPFLLKNHKEELSDKLYNILDKFKENDEEKFLALDDIVNDYDDKILIWGIHPDTIHRICDRYKKLNPVGITGEIPQEERFDIVNKFRLDKDCRMLVANITCLSTSVTITECKCQVYFERSYSFTEYSQSRNRIYRLGQGSDVVSYILIYNNTIDCFLDKNLEDKGTLVDRLGHKEFLTDEEWSKIFNCSESTTFN